LVPDALESDQFSRLELSRSTSWFTAEHVKSLRLTDETGSLREVAIYYPELMPVVLPLVRFYSNILAPELQKAPSETDRAHVVPQIRVGLRRFEDAEMYLGNLLSMESPATVARMLNENIQQTNWNRITPYLPFADYPTAVYFKHLIDQVVSDSICSLLVKKCPGSVPYKKHEIRERVWQVVFPHIHPIAVGTPDRKDYSVAITDQEKRLREKPQYPNFTSDRSLERHIGRHLGEFLALADRMQDLLTPEEAAGLSGWLENINTLLSSKKVLRKEHDRARYLMIAWAAFQRGFEIPLEHTRRGGQKFLYLLDLAQQPKPAVLYAHYPQGRYTYTRFLEMLRLETEILTCFPLDCPIHRFYANKVEEESPWTYLEFAGELWEYAVFQNGRDPRNYRPPNELQARYLKVDQLYSEAAKAAKR
jgi:hypothetical protein